MLSYTCVEGYFDVMYSTEHLLKAVILSCHNAHGQMSSEMTHLMTDSVNLVVCLD